ncbi:MAG TPA: hypothetical protein VG146_02845 [Verrucomicrobiae bacterium]|nr:hypothetical protein [Verrucomicrobiae bacterium]
MKGSRWLMAIGSALQLLIELAFWHANCFVRYALQSLVGSWVEDPEFDAAVQAQDNVDPDLSSKEMTVSGLL